MGTRRKKRIAILYGQHRFVTLPLLTPESTLPELSVLKTFRYGDSSGRAETVSLVDADPWYPGRMLIGLAPVAVELLGRHGYRGYYIDRTDRSLPKAAPGAVSRRGIRDSALLRFVASKEPCGLIEYRYGDVDPAWMIAQIALNWPTSRVVVISATRTNAERLVVCLKRYLGANVGLSLPGWKFDPRRVVVATPRAALRAGMLLADFVIALDAVEAVGLHQQEALRQPMKARVFGLIRIGQRLSAYERDIVAATFGFHRMRILQHDSVPRPVTMFQVAVRGGERVSGRLDAASLKAKAITRHRVRNRIVCAVAKAIEQKDEKALRKLVRWSGWESIRQERAVILVESVDHALTLGKLLPEWAILAGESPDLEGISQLNQLVASESYLSVWHSRRNVILTMDGLRRVDLHRVGVVIRADGLPGVPAVLADRFVSGHKSGRLLVVDLDDRDLHPQLRRWTRQRMDAALDEGWEVFLASGRSYTEVGRFLRRREEIAG